jgi:polyhydroxyalkanoate synthase
MSLVSKAYILDLTPGQSLVEYLVRSGFDVYMIDWGTPRPQDKNLRLEDYVLDFMPECVEKVAEDSGVDEVSMVGYCMGGQLSLMYAALHADGPLKNLVTMATPVNSEGMDLFKKWSDPRYFDVDRIVDELGNVPPELMFSSFEMLRPAQRTAGTLRLAANMRDDEFVKSFLMFDRWGAEQIPFPGECFRQTTKEISWKNKLYTNELELAGRRVDLRNITIPVLNVIAQHDHIAPYEATKDVTRLVGSTDTKDIALKGGHVSLVAGGNAIYRLWPQLNSWLAERSL